ncbi:hypothetical protein Pla123a_23500 [Posidoniimonas polymericola]|uniref:Flippase-like domain-containing protein n=1 Tax=Posidoniimonas polymericola TaxID=2528002 RepID=A0A5C5YPU6_9BACT|nr:YbhN family protein [Posidoniimonas polymericola]TWT76925.1 hypothetical protein Pla123a_23500 [Posidoniimonas polymericola]
MAAGPSPHPVDNRPAAPHQPPIRWVKRGIEATVLAVVLLAFGQTLSDAARGLSASPLRPSLPVAVLSALVYAASMLPISLYWRRVLAAWGQPAAPGPVLRAYYMGNLGKYVPGKAMVVVLRTRAVRALGGQTAPIAASVFVETLTLMAVGGVLAGLLLLVPGLAMEQPWWTKLLAFGLAVGSAGPICPPVMNRLIAFIQRRRNPDQAEPPRLTWRLFSVGWLAAAASWVGMALSLWLAVRSVVDTFPPSGVNLLACLLAVTLPVVAGFLSLIPGGLLVRDGLMVALLAPAAGPEPALAATVLVRLAWIGSEALVCGILAAAGVARRSQ